jgi:CheY-like chemotaxis protein
LIEISIQDQGPGVDDDHLMKIFDPYFSTKDATEKGTGLGLWVVKKILRNHGGKVKLKSTKQGATFITEWPLEVDLECSHSNSEKEVIPGEGRVLLVDDDVLVRDTCMMLLNTIGYEVETACDGVDAYKLYAKIWDQIDFVLLDQKMPRMSGSECLKKLVLINPDVKVILTSGNLIKSIEPDLEDNIVGNLPKPYTIQVLSEVMEQAALDLAR